MNEGVFPRTIREDAFLRDRDREVLETDLGYKVNQKLTGYDEEKLLFTLLVGASRERLYCSYQRADDSGRALAPSWYIDELKQALAGQGRECEVVTIPRSLIEKSTIAPFDRQELLLPGELAVRLTLQNQDPTSLIEASGNLPTLYQQGRKLVGELDRSRRSLVGLRRFGRRARLATGNISPSAAWRRRRWKPTRVVRFNFSPARCLACSRSNVPKKRSVPMPPKFGELGHAILNGFYLALIDGGYFTGKTPAVNIENTLAAVASRAFADYEANNPVGYPLAWETSEGRINATAAPSDRQRSQGTFEFGLCPGESGNRHGAKLAGRLARQFERA